MTGSDNDVVRQAVDGPSCLKDAGMFIADYAARLWGCGATCIRIEKNVRRIAGSFGLPVEFVITPSHINLTIWSNDRSEAFSIIRKHYKSPISFNINTRLSKLSWDIAEGRRGFEDARNEFWKICKTKAENPYKVLLLVSLANASFCRLFGGDAVSMLIVFLSTLGGYRIKQIMLEDKIDVRLVFLVASFFSAVASASGHLFGLGSTPETALASSVLYLIPGIPYINSVSDMLDGHYVCAFSRFMDGLMLTACIALGFCGGLFMMSLDFIQ